MSKLTLVTLFVLLLTISVTIFASPIQQLQLLSTKVAEPQLWDFGIRSINYWNGEHNSNFNVSVNHFPVDQGRDWQVQIAVSGIDLIDNLGEPHLITGRFEDDGEMWRNPAFTYAKFDSITLSNFPFEFSHDRMDMGVTRLAMEIMFRNKRVDQNNFMIQLNATSVKTGQSYYSSPIAIKPDARLVESANFQFTPAPENPTVGRDFTFTLTNVQVALDRETALTTNSSPDRQERFFRAHVHEQDPYHQHTCSWGPGLENEVKVIINPAKNGHYLTFYFHELYIPEEGRQVIDIGKTVQITCPTLWFDFSTHNGKAPTFQFFHVKHSFDFPDAAVSWSQPSI